MPLLMTEMVVFALNLTHPRLADKTFGLPAIWQTTTLILLVKMSMITGKSYDPDYEATFWDWR